MKRFALLLCLAILTTGLIYIWVKSDLDWVKKLVARDDAQLGVGLTENRPKTAVLEEEVSA